LSKSLILNGDVATSRSEFPPGGASYPTIRHGAQAANPRSKDRSRRDYLIIIKNGKRNKPNWRLNVDIYSDIYFDVVKVERGEKLVYSGHRIRTILSTGAGRKWSPSRGTTADGTTGSLLVRTFTQKQNNKSNWKEVGYTMKSNIGEYISELHPRSWLTEKIFTIYYNGPGAYSVDGSYAPATLLLSNYYPRLPIYYYNRDYYVNEKLVVIKSFP